MIKNYLLKHFKHSFEKKTLTQIRLAFFMDIEIRCVIHFLWLKGNTNKDIYESIIEAYGENSVSLRTVQDRTKKCKQGGYYIFDLQRSGRSKR